MKWVIGYFIIGLITAIISYRLQRRNRNVRKVKKIGGVSTIIMFYTWLWPIGLLSDIGTFIVNRKGGKNENRKKTAH